MFISNTATAAMMLTFLTPVFKALPANGKGRMALTMAIPIGANLGGMGTPIGTPPNIFAIIGMGNRIAPETIRSNYVSLSSSSGVRLSINSIILGHLASGS